LKAHRQEGEPEARIPTEDQPLERGAEVRRAMALVTLAAATAALLSWVGASASTTGDHRQERNVRLVVSESFFVDNDPSGVSGGDLVGSSGEMRHGGNGVGRYSSACTLSPPVGGQCQATLIWRYRDRIQLAGNFRIQADHNRLAIVGGTGKFRDVRGDATLQAVDNQGSVQRVHLTILR
jgi:hypothetical protein